MRHWFALAVFSCLLLLTLSAQSAGTAKKAALKKGAVTKSISKKSGSARSMTLRKTGKKAPSRAAWRTRQSAPTAERYKEIQGALAAKGYLTSEQSTGTWNQASIDALKRFQAEQKIEPTGKINSLSLIALGLGPKRESAESKRATQPQSPVPDSPAKTELQP